MSLKTIFAEIWKHISLDILTLYVKTKPKTKWFWSKGESKYLYEIYLHEWKVNLLVYFFHVVSLSPGHTELHV